MKALLHEWLSLAPEPICRRPWRLSRTTVCQQFEASTTLTDRTVIDLEWYSLGLYKTWSDLGSVWSWCRLFLGNAVNVIEEKSLLFHSQLDRFLPQCCISRLWLLSQRSSSSIDLFWSEALVGQPTFLSLQAQKDTLWLATCVIFHLVLSGKHIINGVKNFVSFSLQSRYFFCWDLIGKYINHRDRDTISECCWPEHHCAWYLRGRKRAAGEEVLVIFLAVSRYFRSPVELWIFSAIIPDRGCQCSMKY